MVDCSQSAVDARRCTMAKDKKKNDKKDKKDKKKSKKK